MDKVNECKEDINRIIKSFTKEEKEKLVKEQNESTKTFKQFATLFIVLGFLSLFASVIILIVSLVVKGIDMESALALFVIAGALICLALFFKSKTKNSGKSTDEVLFDLIAEGLNSTNKWYVNFMKQINSKLVIPYPDFKVNNNIVIRPQKYEYLLIDDEHEEFIIKRGIKYSRKYSFKEVSSYKTLENNVSASENAATGALIGSLIGGSKAVMTGALIGSSETCNSLKIVITLNNPTELQIVLELLNGWILKDSAAYNSVQKRMIEITSALQYMLNKRTDS